MNNVSAFKLILKITFIFFLFTFLASCGKIEIPFTIKNDSDIDRIDEGFSISRAKIEKKIGAIPVQNIPFVYTQENEIIPFQLDDLDGDGKWDELFFLVNVPANSKKKYTLKTSTKEEIPAFEQKTNIRFADIKPPYKALTTAKRLSSTDTKISQTYFQMEGPAWENDKVAFRNYFDARNGIDIYGKRVSDMILDKVGIDGQNYHELDDWGMDILKVGTSLGAGAIAMQIQDSVYRIDFSEDADCKIIIEGPLRSMLEFNFPNWEANGTKYNVNHQISIQAGKRFYESKVSISNLKGEEKLVAGLVRILNDTLYQQESPAKYSYVATHDKQAYDKEHLGMGLIFETENLNKIATAPEAGNGVIQSHLIAFNIQNDEPMVFRSYTCWEFENDKFKDRDYFLDFMKKETEMRNAPLVIGFEN